MSESELWYDEVCTYFVAHHLVDWPVDGPAPRQEVAHWPYYATLHVWTRLFGDDSAALRGFSAAAGILGIVALTGLACAIGGSRLATVIAWLSALHPLHIHYSREARVYTLWLLTLIGATYALWRCARAGGIGWWVAFIAATFLAFGTHYYTIFWIPGTIAAVLVAERPRVFVRQWLAAHAVLAAALVPLLILLVQPMSSTGPRDWFAEVWREYTAGLAVLKSLWVMLPAAAYPDYLGAVSAAARWVAAEWGPLWAATLSFSPAVLTAALLLACFRPKNPRAMDNQGLPSAILAWRAILWLAIMSLAFLLFAMLFSTVVTPVYVVGRYDLAAWPACVIALGLLIHVAAAQSSRRPSIQRGIQWLTLGLYCACGLGVALAARAVPPRSEAAPRARRIAELVDASRDLVISVGMYRWFVLHEWEQMGFEPDIRSFPAVHDRQLCWDNPAAELNDPARIEADIDRLLAEVAAAEKSGRRVWLLAHGEASGGRWAVDRQFFAALQQNGHDIIPADDWSGLARVERHSSE